MIRTYCIRQAGLLCLVSVIMILTNIIGYHMPLKDSIAGILLLSAIALFGLTVSHGMSRFISLPSMLYVSMTGLLLASPISPVKDAVLQITSQVQFMAPATALGALPSATAMARMVTLEEAYTSMGRGYTALEVVGSVPSVV